MPSGEIQTADIVHDAFKKGKQVYVPYIYQLESTTGGKKSSIMEMLALQSVEDYDSLQQDNWGIPSLNKDSLASRQNCLGGNGLQGLQSPMGDGPGLDFIVMPGMAFDESFARLGHGKGYYDYFLNRYHNIMKDSSATRRPYLGEKFHGPFLATSAFRSNIFIGIAALSFQEQMFSLPDKVPVADHDCPVDALIIGDGRVLR